MEDGKGIAISIGITALIAGGVCAIVIPVSCQTKKDRDHNNFDWEGIKKSYFCLVKENEKSKYYLLKKDDNGKYEDTISNKDFDINKIMEYHSAEVYFIQNNKIKSEYTRDELNNIIDQFNVGNDNFIYADEGVVYTWKCIQNSYIGLYKNGEENTVCLLRDNDYSYNDLINGNSVNENEIINLRKAEQYFVESGNVKGEYKRTELRNIVSDYNIDDEKNELNEKKIFTWDDIKKSYIGLVDNNGDYTNTLLSDNDGQYKDMLSNKKVDDKSIIECYEAVPYFVQTDNVKVEYTNEELKTIVSKFDVGSKEYTTDNSKIKVKE